MEHKKVESYSGKYLGVPYEIRHWSYSNGTPQWNYYIFLSEKQIPSVFKSLWLKPKVAIVGSNHIYYDYSKTLISNLDWHCGCTYYEKISGLDKQTKIVKVGCDYGHIWDEGKSYSIADIERDVIDCINSLVERVKVLQWCSYCGAYVEEVDARTHCSDCKDK